MPVRYGIIGAGMMAQEHIRNISLFPDTKIIGIADPNEPMRGAAQSLAREATMFADAAGMISALECDAFVVATPNDTHFEILSELIKLRRPILTEKPLCTTIADCRRVMSAARRHGTAVWVAMEYRYMPPLARLIAELEAGTAGHPVMVSIREHRFPFLEKVDDWNRFNKRTGGTMVEKCCHFWDLMRLLLKSDPIRVYASGSIAVNHLDERYAGQAPDITDNAFAVVDFANGSRGMLDLCMFAEGSDWQETVSVTGPLARVDAKVPGPIRYQTGKQPRIPEITVNYRGDKPNTVTAIPVDATLLDAGDHCGSTYYQHEKFLQLVVGAVGTPAVTLMDGSWAVSLGQAAEESIRSGEAVPVQAP
ncbi:MAG: Gfo/Idh/MocA family oxidoreductase [Rhodobacteraceae bacterium]|nr:Gfo/Idh/MocA family oxidoreductase [Paracoccaceae bacterium]